MAGADGGARGEVVANMTAAIVREFFRLLSASGDGAVCRHDNGDVTVNLRFNPRTISKAALRSLIEEPADAGPLAGRFGVATELILYGGKEPGSVQSMMKVCIEGALAGAERAEREEAER